MAEPEAAQGAAREAAQGGAREAAQGGAREAAQGGAREAAQATGAGDVGILFVGDLVGSIGRHTLLECLPVLRERYAPTFVVVNGENVAGGLGITPKVAEELFREGIDAITLGNHAYRRREIYSYLETHERIVRPFNYLQSQPGRGLCVVEKDGVRLGVVNLSGNLFLKAGSSAFTAIETALDKLEGVDHILVDMHAEATSEKIALGWLLDGRVTAVVGTHTHVPTADARVLPGGTAYITDVGMTGPRGGVIGVKREQAVEALVTQMPVRFETSKEDPWLMGVLVRCSKPLRADSIEQILMARPDRPTTTS
jgi:metallophosphoesterase (TIGR00282 family)